MSKLKKMFIRGDIVSIDKWLNVKNHRKSRNLKQINRLINYYWCYGEQ